MRDTVSVINKHNVMITCSEFLDSMRDNTVSVINKHNVSLMLTSSMGNRFFRLKQGGVSTTTVVTVVSTKTLPGKIHGNRKISFETLQATLPFCVSCIHSRTL